MKKFVIIANFFLFYGKFKISLEYILSMEELDFKNKIKQLRQQHLQAMQKYYNEGNIIFKMAYERQVYQNLYEADLGFRTCMLNKFSDKRLSKLVGKGNIRKAVETLRGRALTCLYTTSIINTFVDESDPRKSEQRDAIQDLVTINKQLCDMAQNSLLTADDWSICNNIELMDKPINVDEYRL